MKRINKNLVSFIGMVGAWVCVIVFLLEPSFPTPDKLLVFLTFVFMAVNQALPMLKRLLPFVAILLAYESFRGLAPHLNSNVNFEFMPAADKLLFGELPTKTLQDWLWFGQVRWYDFVFYFPYLLHFVLPIILALIVWKTRPQQYWRFVTSFLVVSYMAFLCFLAFPAAPPWMASNLGYIDPVQRISSDVWFAFGLSDFPSFYNAISPNPVAAVPSLHAAWAILFCFFVFKLFGNRWGMVSTVYPLLIFVGTVYQGEHYVIDVIVGIIFAIVAYVVTPSLLNFARRIFKRLKVIKS